MSQSRTLMYVHEEQSVNGEEMLQTHLCCFGKNNHSLVQCGSLCSESFETLQEQRE